MLRCGGQEIILRNCGKCANKVKREAIKTIVVTMWPIRNPISPLFETVRSVQVGCQKRIIISATMQPVTEFLKALWAAAAARLDSRLHGTL